MNNVNQWVIEYREAAKQGNERLKNRLIKKIASIYEPKLYSIISNYPQRYKDDFISQYYYNILTCIDSWDEKRGVLFTTHLYIYVTAKLKSEVTEKIINKTEREPSFELIFNEDEDNDEEG